MKKILFKILIIILFLSSYSNAELIKPRSDIKPKEVVKIQLTGLQKMTLVIRIEELSKLGFLLIQITKK